LLAPPVAYGASGEHETFPGTVSIGHDALRAVLVELGRSACRWASRLVFVNGHGGNLAAVTGAVTLLRAEQQRGLGASAVRTDVAEAGNTAPLADLLPAMRRGSVRAVSGNGVLGDPTGAGAAEGEQLLAALVEELQTALARWCPGADGRLTGAE
jgi:creatinine amidohydrolase/Fe(II)-dependent formamide hydrolase-like protein